LDKKTLKVIIFYYRQMKLQLIEQFQNYHLQVIKIIMEMIKKLCNIFSKFNLYNQKLRNFRIS